MKGVRDGELLIWDIGFASIYQTQAQCGSAEEEGPLSHVDIALITGRIKGMIKSFYERNFDKLLVADLQGLNEPNKHQRYNYRVFDIKRILKILETSNFNNHEYNDGSISIRSLENHFKTRILRCIQEDIRVFELVYSKHKYTRRLSQGICNEGTLENLLKNYKDHLSEMKSCLEEITQRLDLSYQAALYKEFISSLKELIDALEPLITNQSEDFKIVDLCNFFKALTKKNGELMEIEYGGINLHAGGLIYMVWNSAKSLFA